MTSDLPTEPAPARAKPRRFMLYAPFVLIAGLLLLYGGYWLVAKTGLEAGLDRRAESLRQAGYQVELSGRRVDGFPFRMRIGFDTVRLAAPGGWGFEAQGLKAEAYLHDLGHWVIAAPQGLTVVRPRGGPVIVHGDVLRASIAGLNRSPWRVVLEGVKLGFTPGPAALPFSLASADRLEAYLRPAPDGGADGEVLIRLRGGKATPGTVVWRLAGDKPVTATLDARIVKPAAFRGGDWSAAVKAWAAAGGQAQLLKTEAQAGATALWGTGGSLSVGADGRLDGAVPLEMRQASQGLTALSGGGLDPDAARSAAVVAAARDHGGSATMALTFQAGAATLGPVRIGPSPRIY